MAQAIRPPASPVGSVLSDTHSMSPGNGASSSILPGSEEGIGGRHGFPTRSRSPLSTTSGRNRPRCWTIPVCASPSSRRWRGQRRRRFCQRTDCHHFGAAHRAGRRPGRQADPTRLGIRQRGPSDRGSQGRARGPNAVGARAKGATRRSPAPEPAFGHAAGRKCPLAKGTAAAILPTGWAGRTESF